jgi:hypothetical protein
MIRLRLPAALLIFLCVWLTESARAELRISTDFDSGSLGGWEIGENGEIHLRHTSESGGLWYHFQVDGVRGKSVTFVFDSVRADYFGDLSLPAVSYDQVHWHWIKQRTILPLPEDPTRVRYTFTHRFTVDRAWVAYAPAFNNPRLDDWIQRIQGHPHLTVETICETPLRRLPVPLLQISDATGPPAEQQTLLLLAREDSYETAGSWFVQGMADFLLSNDPVAAELKRRAEFLLVPLFDRDGVALGHALHPLPALGESVFWTETWTESQFSFHEQRQFKLFLQRWKDQGRRIDGVLRVHSNGWQTNLLRPEHLPPESSDQSALIFNTVLHGKYFPIFLLQEPQLLETRFTQFVADLFPSSISAYLQTDFIYSPAFGSPFDLYKTPDDLRAEGELFARGVAEILGIVSSDPPPFLLAAECYELTGSPANQFHVRCVYRDLLNRPPEYVRVVVNDTAYNLTPVGPQNRNFSQGVTYSGFLTLDPGEFAHYFLTSNGSQSRRLPDQGTRPGPFTPATK